MKFKQLKLENQLCFPVYAASRLIIREYKPYLEKLGITYPQYLVLMVLWEKGRLSVNGVSQKLILNTNTVTPLLKRMESLGYIKRRRSESDERKVMVELTKKGKQLQTEATSIPGQLASGLISEAMQREDLSDLKDKLQILIRFLMEKKQAEFPTEG